MSEITSETAEKFRFSLQQFLKHEAFKDCGGVQLADGGWLITSNDGTAGKEEFYRYLLFNFIFGICIKFHNAFVNLLHSLRNLMYLEHRNICKSRVQADGTEDDFVIHCPQSIM